MSFLGLRRSVHAIALGVASLVAVSFPLLFFAIAHSYEVNQLSFKAELSASKVAKYIFANERLWQYQRVRIAEIIEFNSADVKVHQAVREASGREIVAVGEVPQMPHLSRHAPIVVGGRVVGEIVATESLRPLLAQLSFAALGSCVLALITYVAVRTLPLRALDRTLGRLEATNSELVVANERLALQTQQLSVAQRIGRIGHWNFSFSDKAFGWSPEALELIGKHPLEIVRNPANVFAICTPESRNLLIDADRRLRTSRGVEKLDIKFKQPNGTIVDLSVIAHAELDPAGQVVGFSGTIQDITERKRAEEQLEALAYYDPLTGLANRSLFQRALNTALASADAGLEDGALLLLDLDHFKEVNDTLGHGAGDALLIEMVRRIRDVLEPSHFFARLGGDEFAILIRNSASYADIASRVLSAATGQISLEAGQVVSSASIGVCRLGPDGRTSTDLLRNADLALYHAKGAGRGRVAFFDESMDTVMRNKTEVARELRQCMQDGTGLHLHYQPQLDLRSGSVMGFEALVRWTSPERGNVPPSVFIPIAESSRLICELGSWVMRSAALQAKAWIDAGEPPREIAVNVSAAQIWHSDLIGEVEKVLAETGLPPHLLCLELTESLMADQSDARVRAVLTNLKARGVTLALDDFGTGYSSLSYLSELPFDKLKIDRSFVGRATQSEHARELLRGIISLGHGLGLKVQAEGAEDPAEVDILRNFDTDLVQGFLFSRPVPPHAAIAYARSCETDDATDDESGSAAATAHVAA